MNNEFLEFFEKFIIPEKTGIMCFSSFKFEIGHNSSPKKTHYPGFFLDSFRVKKSQRKSKKSLFSSLAQEQMNQTTKRDWIRPDLIGDKFPDLARPGGIYKKNNL